MAEEDFMDDLLQQNLPEPHQHIAAPPPDALPDPSKLSTTTITPQKRKQKAKATSKAPAKRRRTTTKSVSRSPSPTTTWTMEEKQKLRTLKSNEKSRFSWRVISTKMVSKYVPSFSFGSLLFATSHGPGSHFAYYTILLPNQGTFFFHGYLTVSSTTGLDSPIYHTTSSSYITIGFEAHAATC